MEVILTEGIMHQTGRLKEGGYSPVMEFGMKRIESRLHETSPHSSWAATIISIIAFLLKMRYKF
jgi:hypothetical protein